MRSLSDKSKIDPIHKANPNSEDRLTLVEADLSDDAVWEKVTVGMEFIIHIASPYLSVEPANPDDMILPAVNGTKAILHAAIKNGVKKVVLTSSCLAIFMGRQDKQEFNEDDWSDPTNPPPTERANTWLKRRPGKSMRRTKINFSSLL